MENNKNKKRGTESIDQLCVSTIRMLAVDMVEKAKSGHPGMPLGAAPMAFVLWDRFLKHNPNNPDWFNRDRFVLSAGHGSTLLYALLHLYGYDLSLEELQNFRQWGSKTPGHPEYALAPGVESTTGPLGQGFAMGVGMAIAERYTSALFAADDAGPLIDHHTYAIVSDGDLMEGVSCEAASLAGTLGLGKLIYLYDDNGITIEGPTSLAFTENVERRFEAYGWQVLAVEDGNDLNAIETAISDAQLEPTRPSLVCVRTHIGYGSPKQDSEKSHGEPLGAEAAASTREFFGWPDDRTFHIPDEARAHFGKTVERGASREAGWNARFAAHCDADPELGTLMRTSIGGGLPDGWDRNLPAFTSADEAIATRAASGKVLNALAKGLPTLIGGSADLGSSNKSVLVDESDFGIDGPEGRNLHFGVREHAMGAIVNGMALHGGVHPFGATFLVFADYMRPSLRLSAMMKTRSIFIFTHDSIGVGEDGPTHQPVEQLASLRAIPGFTVFRPADASETVAVWRLAVERDCPCALALTRQKLPVLAAADRGAVTEGVPRGAYVLAEPTSPPVLVLVATGSEVHLALEAQERLAKENVATRVVSMPSCEVFFEQSLEYRVEVLPPGVPKLAIEAGVTLGWGDIVGDDGAVIGLDRFGGSAPGPIVMRDLGFNVDNVLRVAKRLVGEGA